MASAQTSNIQGRSRKNVNLEDFEIVLEGSAEKRRLMCYNLKDMPMFMQFPTGDSWEFLNPDG